MCKPWSAPSKGQLCPPHKSCLLSNTELWAVFFPVAVECSCLVYLTGLKVYFERLAGAGGPAAVVEPQSSLLEKANGTPGGGSTRINGLLASSVGVGRSPRMSKYGATASG